MPSSPVIAATVPKRARRSQSERVDAPAPPVLATVWRGTVVEARIRAHVAVVDASGEVLSSAGSPDAETTLRSCVKPLQALPFLRLAAESLGAGDAEIAIACASHQGEDE